jgi:hypothetical protein
MVNSTYFQNQCRQNLYFCVGQSIMDLFIEILQPLKEHGLSLRFCVFDNTIRIRIWPYVLECIGINFSTMDDDSPFHMV